MGQCHSGLGQWHKADALLLKSRNEAERVGDARSLEECSLFLAFNKVLQGDITSAFADAEIVNKSARLRGDLQMQVMSSIVQATGFYYLGNLAPFEERLTQLDGYAAPGINFEMDSINKILYHGLSGLRWLKRGELMNAMEEAKKAKELFALEPQPSLYYSFLGLYHALLVQIFVVRKQEEASKSTQASATAIKKFTSRLAKDFKMLEDFCVVFPIAAPCMNIIKGLLEQSLLKKKNIKAFEDALAQAHDLGMSYYKALVHQWIGLSMDIRDTQKDVQIKLRHKDTAMEMFIQLQVNESQLFW